MKPILIVAGGAVGCLLGAVLPFLGFAWGGVFGLVGGFVVWLAGRAKFKPLEEGEFKHVVEAVDEPLVVYDQNFRIRYFNTAAEQLFGIKAADILGKTVEPRDADAPTFRVFVQTMFPSLAPSFTPLSKEGEYPERIDLSFGEPQLELRTLTAPVFSPQGAKTGFVKLIQDRTQELALMRSKSDFITVASHQLRTPLTELSWALQALAGDIGMTPASMEVVHGAELSVRTLLEMVEELLDLAKIEEGKFTSALQMADLRVFLDQVLAGALAGAKSAGVQLFLDAPQGELSPVAIDEEKLSMAVRNIVDNGVRYNTKNGEVRVIVAPKNGYYEIAVRDTGIGIPADQVGKLFTRFFRADNAIRFQTKGSGLGLYIAKMIIEGHGGRVWVESELNRGTTVYFTLPMANAPVAVPTA